MRMINYKCSSDIDPDILLRSCDSCEVGGLRAEFVFIDEASEISAQELALAVGKLSKVGIAIIAVTNSVKDLNEEMKKNSSMMEALSVETENMILVMKDIDSRLDIDDIRFNKAQIKLKSYSQNRNKYKSPLPYRNRVINNKNSLKRLNKNSFR